MGLEIALVGDYSEKHLAHRAIPRALELAAAELNVPVNGQWIMSRDLIDIPRQLAPFSAVWAVPASPYENAEGVLEAIRWARESGIPFLGTCGGFQHALIEFARNVAGLTAADHTETLSGGETLVVTRLSCSLVDQTGGVRFAPDSRIRAAYGTDTATEGYRCSYGVNPAYASALTRAGLRFTAWDEAGDIRAAELPAHPFFVGTLFQPERAALRGQTPPLVRAFVAAALASQVQRSIASTRGMPSSQVASLAPRDSAS